MVILNYNFREKKINKNPCTIRTFRDTHLSPKNCKNCHNPYNVHTYSMAYDWLVGDMVEPRHADRVRIGPRGFHNPVTVEISTVL